MVLKQSEADDNWTGTMTDGGMLQTGLKKQ